MGKRIRVHIDKAGNPKFEAIGYVGSECEQATAGFEKLFGGAVETQKKPEYFAVADATEDTWAS